MNRRLMLPVVLALAAVTLPSGSVGPVDPLAGYEKRAHGAPWPPKKSQKKRRKQKRRTA